ncbi:MAG: hypothetical protein OXE41_07230 [Gammaproteobacteria bacterium]|nr:hypothetical protein [Gammaproteobacteria bacterium]MCY4275168.1 hypothetical protein [Gammaproteobacteria bacterium]
MNFLDHTMIWAKGETFDMLLLALVGTLLFVIAGLLWKFAPTPVGQALPIPLSVVAMIFIIAGMVSNWGNSSRLAQYESAYEQSAASFVHAEKARVSAFEAIYTYTIIGAAIAFAIAIVLFQLSENETIRAIAITLALIGLSGLVIDMFSKERATTYEQAIDAEIARLNALTNDTR